MKTILEPNREIQFKSAVLGLQIAHNEFRKAIDDYLKWTGYNDNGKFYTYSGHADRANAVKEWGDEVLRQKAVVDGMLMLRGGDKGWAK